MIAASALVLGGCDMMHAMLPRHGTNEADARAAISGCGIPPASIAWSVGTDGTFAFGRKSADASPLSYSQNECLMRWVEKNRVKVEFIGWETGLANGR